MESTQKQLTETKQIQQVATIIKSSTSQIIQQINNTDQIKQARIQQKKIREEHEQRLRNYEIKKLLEGSLIPKRYLEKSTENFIIKDTNRQAVNALNNSADSFYIYGDCGAGKTFLAVLLAKESVSSSLASVKFFTATNLIYILNPYKTGQFQEDKENQVSRHQVYNCGILIIDDLGVENPNSFNQSILFDIINHRYNENLQTIITSNFEIKALQKRLKSYEGGRIGRRITEMCKPIFLKPFF